MGVDAEKKAGSQIGDREGEAVGAIPETELALVVSSPDVVGALWDGLRAARVGPPIAAPWPNQPMPGEDAGSGRQTREMRLGVALLEQVEQDGRAPVCVCLAKVDDLLDDGGVDLQGGAMRPAGELVVAVQAGLLEAVDPLVGGSA